MVTLDYAETLIVDKAFYRFPDTTMTVCCATTKHGVHVVGTSACIDPAKFDAEVGIKIAYEKALARLYDLESYWQKCKFDGRDDSIE